VVGVDISRPMIEFGLAKGLRDVVFADGARLPFVARSFDAATTNHVLHLIANWAEVLNEIARVTRETYFTVIERSDRPSINFEYVGLVRAAGFEWRHPGVHERDLPSLLKPDLIIPVGPFDETTPADVLLRELQDRVFSNQWAVPERIHQNAIAGLRKQWAGKDFVRSTTLEVTFWSADRLPELTYAANHRS
jgi:SAM-dependent methyltransferase